MNQRAHTLPEIAQALLAAQEVAVISHYNPDGDAFSASLGLTQILRMLGKKVVVYNESGVSARYSFIPTTTEVQTKLPGILPECIVLVDCGDLKRAGDSYFEVLSKHPNLINIDHHVSNNHFGLINFVDGAASSTAEIIIRLAYELKVAFTPALATTLLVGLVSDTGSFRYSCTSPATLRYAAAMVEAGANLPFVGRSLFEQRTLNEVMLKADLMNRLERHADGRVLCIVSTEEDLNRHGAVQEDLDGLVEDVRSITGCLAAAMIRRDGDIWRVSLRSKDDRIDLSAVATKFGGGGHRPAAAFRWRKSLDELRAELLPALAKATELS
jgi:phosphoesterase RecJ-like protein